MPETSQILSCPLVYILATGTLKVFSSVRHGWPTGASTNPAV